MRSKSLVGVLMALVLMAGAAGGIRAGGNAG